MTRLTQVFIAAALACAAVTASLPAKAGSFERAGRGFSAAPGHFGSDRAWTPLPMDRGRPASERPPGSNRQSPSKPDYWRFKHDLTGHWGNKPDALRWKGPWHKTAPHHNHRLSRQVHRDSVR